MHSSRLRISAGSALGRRHLIGGLVAVAGGACIRKPNLGEAGFRTRLAPPPAGLTLDPPAPPNLFWLSISSARVPPRAPGGRMWDRTSGWPDVVVRVSFAGRVQLETPSATNRLEPTWTRGVASANFELLPDTVLEVEMRDVDTFRDKPIGRGQLLRPSAADLARGEVEINVGRPGNRGNVILDVETAHALWGTGFDYERVSGGVVVSRVLKHSPAARAGLVAGDELIRIGERDLRGLKAIEQTSAVNSIRNAPVAVVAQHEGGTTENVSLAQGPCYPTHDEIANLK